jgi:hypothetical protein
MVNNRKCASILSSFHFFHLTIQVISRYSHIVTYADDAEASFAHISVFRVRISHTLPTEKFELSTDLMEE